MTDQPRDDDGRWAETNHAEPDSDLSQANVVSAAGSFYWPPNFTTAESVYDFVKDCELPDEAITRYVNVYARVVGSRFDELVRLRMEDTMRNWDAEHPSGPSMGDIDRRYHNKRRAEFEAKALAEERKALETHPRTIPRSEARWVVRMMRAWQFAHDLDDTEYWRMMHSEPDEDDQGQTMSLRVLAEYWHAPALASMLEQPDPTQTSQEMAALRAQIAKLDNDLSYRVTGQIHEVLQKAEQTRRLVGYGLFDDKRWLDGKL